MMKPRDRWRRVLVLVVFVVLGWTGRADALPVLSFACQVDCSAVNQGDSFDLEIRIEDITDLVSFSFFLSYNPLVLAINSGDVKDGGFLGSGSFFTLPSSLASPLLIGNSLPSGSGKSTDPGTFGVLAAITFQAIGAGTTNIALSSPEFFNSIVTCQQEPENEDCDPDPLANFIEVSTVPVPEPATIGLLGLGLVALARRVRRQRRTA